MDWRILIPYSFCTTVLMMLFAPMVDARVARFEIEQRRVFAEGKEFGTVGSYERLDGTVYMEVDPDDPLNAVIVNLDKSRSERAWEC